MKKIFYILPLLACSLLLFGGCSLFYDLYSEEQYDIGYSKSENNAYLSRFIWDGDFSHTEFTIPDTYQGAPVTELGGYFGRGVPCPFCIEPPAGYTYADEEEESKAENLVFTIYMGVNVKEVTYVSAKEYLKTEDGKIYKFCYFFVVPEENEYFTATDGKLYFRDGTLVEDFFYE